MDDTIRKPPPPKRTEMASSPMGSDIPAVAAAAAAAVTTTINNNNTNFLDVMVDSLLRNSTSYLPNEDLMKFSLASKRTNTSIPRATNYDNRAPGTIIPVLYMSPSETSEHERPEDRGRFEQLLHQLQQLRVQDPNVLEGYQHASMMDLHEFTFKNTTRLDGGILTFLTSSDKHKELVREIRRNGPRIRGITSLDFCFSTAPAAATPINSLEESYVLKTLLYLLPSLREVDFTNTYATNFTVRDFFENCPRLEKITIQNNRGPYFNSLHVDGSALKSANMLKELHLDNSTLFVDDREVDVLPTLLPTLLLQKCSSTVLERVSLRNAKVMVLGRPGHHDMPQTALLNFIRTAPTTLRWFRSNLTKDNIAIVQQERPAIEFVQ